MVLMVVGQREHLGIDAGQDPGQDVGAETLEVDDPRALQRRRDALTQRLRVGVGGTAQPELDVGEGVGEQLPAAHQPGTVRGAPELEGRRPLDERLVEVEKGGSSAAAGEFARGLRPIG